MNFEDIVQCDKEFMLNTYQRYPIALEKGKGTKLWDVDGKEYLDFLGGIAVLPLGHCHPEVTKAIVKQAETLAHTSNLFYSKPTLELAQRLIELGDFNKVFLCNSGTEANEGAIKLARKYQWRKGLQNKFKIVSASHSFHGRTFAAMAATDKKELKEGYAPLPEGFSTVEWNNVEALESAIDESTAAFLIEPVQGEGGIYPANSEFLAKARELCDRFGALLIFDEIQCGLGRLGTFFAYQSFGVRPDIVTLAKGLANGLPIGAICANNDAAKGFKPGDHGTTFGGNLICAAAACATIETIVSKKYCDHVSKISMYFYSQLKDLQSEFSESIVDVRGKGLMLGVELKDRAQDFVRKCFSKGLILNITAKNVLRFLPSYLIEESEVNAAIHILRKCLEESQEKSGA